MRKSERPVIFLPGPLESLPGTPGQDVVADDVVLSVVLVESAAFTTIYEVVLHHDLRTALIRIEAPAAVIVRIDVMDDVVVHGRSRLDPQGIDAAHVVEFSPSEVMDVVESDLIVEGEAWGVSPDPSHGKTAVTKVADLVVKRLHAGRFADQDPHAGRKHLSPLADDVVDDLNILGRVDLHPASAEVIEERVFQPAVVRKVERDGIIAGVPDFTVLQDDVFRIVQHHRRIKMNGCLVRDRTLGRQEVGSMLE